jgi:hypothetical protein
MCSELTQLFLSFWVTNCWMEIIICQGLVSPAFNSLLGTLNMTY